MEKSKSFFKIISLVIAAVVLIVIIVLAAHANSLKYENLKTQIQLEKQLVQQKTVLYKKILAGMFAMREANAEIKADCKLPAYNAEKSQLLRLHGQLEFHLLVMDSDGTFGEPVSGELKSLMAFDKSIKNICSPDAPKDEAWNNKESQIIDAMIASIEANHTKLNYMEDKLMDYSYVAV